MLCFLFSGGRSGRKSQDTINTSRMHGPRGRQFGKYFILEFSHEMSKNQQFI